MAQTFSLQLWTSATRPLPQRMDLTCETIFTVMPLPPLPENREIYGRAPVMEAAIDIRCINRPNFTMADVALLAEALSNDFRQEAEAVERTEEVRSDGARRVTERPVGLVLRRYPDDRGILQVQVEGFTYSQTAPYERWEPFSQEAERLWSRYCNEAEPQAVTRIGVRYINRLEIGDAIEDLSPFLNVYPVTPWKLKSPPSGFSLQIRLPHDDDSALVVNVATVLHARTQQIAILLDLDALQADVACDVKELWNVVEELHVKVERAFEGLITDRMRELIR